jgi:hypothetical protein
MEKSPTVFVVVPTFASNVSVGPDALRENPNLYFEVRFGLFPEPAP